MEPTPLSDDDVDALEFALGQAHHLLGEDGDQHAQRLIAAATLKIQRDGGYFHPYPEDNWRADTYQAILAVPDSLLSEFTEQNTERIWAKLRQVLRVRGREDVFGIVVEPALPPLPDVPADWRTRVAQAPPPANQARRETVTGGYPVRDGLTFASRAELMVYDLLVAIQKDCRQDRSVVVMPLPGAKLRDAGVKTPDFVVLGNGRALVIEVDGPHHYGVTRKADDADRDRHWSRCGVHTIRIGTHHTEEPQALAKLLREELGRWLFAR